MEGASTCITATCRWHRLRHVFEMVQPDEVYNLAAQSHVRVSFDMPEYTADVVAAGTLRLLEAMRDTPPRPKRPRFYQAGSSEMFGAAKPPQSEYAVLSAQSLRRQQSRCSLVCRQLPRSLRPLHLQRHPLQSRIAAPRRDLRHPQNHARWPHQGGAPKELFLGNLEAKRDWGYAGDYVAAMWMMLQLTRPTIMSLPPAKPIPSANSSTWPAPTAASIGPGMSKPTRATSALPRSII